MIRSCHDFGKRSDHDFGKRSDHDFGKRSDHDLIKVGDIAELTKKTSLVDVCCGTGTIGLTLADRAGQVKLGYSQEMILKH